MKYNLSRLPQYYYSSILLITVLIMGIFGRQFWSDNSLDLDNAITIIESNLQLENIKNQNGIEEIKNFIKNGRLEEAMFYTKILQKKVNYINSSISVRSFGNFNEKLQGMRKNLVRLVNHSDLESIILIFDEKSSNFLSFVRKNKWRTLTREIEIIRSKTHSFIIVPKDFFNFNKLKEFYNFISKDIRKIKKIVKKSSLSNQNKKNIMEKMKYLNIEIDRIQEYLFSIKILNSSFDDLNSIYSNWINEIEPAVALEKVKIEKNNKKSTIIYWNVLCLLIFSIILSYFVCRVNNLVLRKKIGAIILEVIKKGLIPFKTNLDIDFGNEFKEEFEKYRKCFHNRVNLGIIFQKTIPFSSALFDSNLNLIWANSLFYERFDIEKGKSTDCLSWSFFQKSTNLVGDDVILAALKQNIAGIYQIQIKNDGSKKIDSYEMYITPVEYEEQSRVAIFLYPLSNLEETIANQKDSIISPVSQMLDSLISNISTDEIYKKLKRDFENSGVLKIFEKFRSYNKLIIQQKESFMEEIEELQNSLKYRNELKKESEDLLSNIKKINESTIEKFENSEKSIVEYMEIHKELEKKIKTLLGFFEFLFLNKNNIVENGETAERAIEENLKMLKSIDVVKNKLKGFKSQIDSYGNKLNQLVEQVSFVARNKDSNGKYLEEKMEKMKVEIKGVEKISICFNDIIKSFDIIISKSYLILEGWQYLNFDKLKNELKIFENNFKSFKMELNKTKE